MILRVQVLSILLGAALACGAVANAAQPHLATKHSSTPQSAQALKNQGSYSLGVLMGAQLRQLGLTPASVEVDRVEKGLHDVVKGTVKASDADRKNVKALLAKRPATSRARVEPTFKRKASYSLGIIMGTRLRGLGVTTDSVAFHQFARGLHDVVKGSVAPSAADAHKVQGLIVRARVTAARENEAAAHKFLAANAKRKGVVTTTSGLQYKVIHAGSGASPHPTDRVTVNYRGSLLDGTVFDSSSRHGGPLTFTVDKVIPGWQEALAMMKPGARWELYVPADLAYGNNSSPPIPPGSLLTFEVDLLRVRPAGASPKGAAPSIRRGKP